MQLFFGGKSVPELAFRPLGKEPLVVVFAE